MIQMKIYWIMLLLKWNWFKDVLILKLWLWFRVDSYYVQWLRRRSSEVSDDLQNIVIIFGSNGFGGIGDLIANQQLMNKLIYNCKTKKQVSKLTQQVHKEFLKILFQKQVEEEYEKKVNNLLNKALSKG